jgi:hypothetical protein
MVISPDFLRGQRHTGSALGHRPRQMVPTAFEIYHAFKSNWLAFLAEFLLDSEAVVLGVDGIVDFKALHSRKHDAEGAALRR